MKAWKHATKIAIMEFVLANRATIYWITERCFLHLGDHGDIFKVDEIWFYRWKSLFLDSGFYRWEEDVSPACAIIVAHLRWLRIINVDEVLILGLIFDLSELSLINIRNSLIDVLNPNKIFLLLIATSHNHSYEKDDCEDEEQKDCDDSDEAIILRLRSFLLIMMLNGRWQCDVLLFLKLHLKWKALIRDQFQ